MDSAFGVADWGRAEEAVRLVTEGESVKPAAPAVAAALFRRAAEITSESGDVSMSAGAYEREIQAWAAAGDSRRARQAADQALAAIGRVEDLDLRVALTTNVATALGSAGFDDDAAFAAAFLMPANALRIAFGGQTAPTEQFIADLLARYRVSLDAVAFRLHNLGLINAAGRDNVRRMSSARIALRQGRAVDLQARYDRRVPGGLLGRAVEAYVRGQISIRPLAGLLGTDPDALLDELSPPRLAPPDSQPGGEQYPML